MRDGCDAEREALPGFIMASISRVYEPERKSLTAGDLRVSLSAGNAGHPRLATVQVP